MSVSEVHEEKNTFHVDVNIPGHEPRTATALFNRTREALKQRDGARCWICGQTGTMEAHHHPIERSFAEMIDWRLVARDGRLGELGITHAQRDANKAFDWDGFLNAHPFDPYAFVDDMLLNGALLCKTHHIKCDEGIHNLPFPVWVAQRYALEGYKFSDVEIIHHDYGALK